MPPSALRPRQPRRRPAGGAWFLSPLAAPRQRRRRPASPRVLRFVSVGSGTLSTKARRIQGSGAPSRAATSVPPRCCAWLARQSRRPVMKGVAVPGSAGIVPAAWPVACRVRSRHGRRVRSPASGAVARANAPGVRSPGVLLAARVPGRSSPSIAATVLRWKSGGHGVDLWRWVRAEGPSGRGNSRAVPPVGVISAKSARPERLPR
jgi:hypothetical protein